MKRQELIHVHALLFEVGEYLRGDNSIPDDVFAHYKTQPTRPHDIHRNKDAHGLVDCITVNVLCYGTKERTFKFQAKLWEFKHVINERECITE